MGLSGLREKERKTKTSFHTQPPKLSLQQSDIKPARPPLLHRILQHSLLLRFLFLFFGLREVSSPTALIVVRTVRLILWSLRRPPPAHPACAYGGGGGGGPFGGRGGHLSCPPPAPCLPCFSPCGGVFSPGFALLRRSLVGQRQSALSCFPTSNLFDSCSRASCGVHQLRKLARGSPGPLEASLVGLLGYVGP